MITVGDTAVLIYPLRIPCMSEKLIICIIFLFGHVLLLVENVYFDLCRNSQNLLTLIVLHVVYYPLTIMFMLIMFCTFLSF